MRVSLQIHGMSCASCVSHVEGALKNVPGVAQVAVNLATDTATILGKDLKLDSLIAAVEGSGYEAEEKNRTRSDAGKRAELRTQMRLFILSAVLSLPLVFPMFVGPSVVLPAWIQSVLATIVQFYVGARFYRSAYVALRGRSANMDVLVALGTSAAYFLSLFMISRGEAHHVYFESSSVVITLVLLGKWIEAKARLRTSTAIRALENLRPAHATVIRNGIEQELSVDELRSGDLVVVKPGERVAADGVIIEGESELDQSMMTGESLPVLKGPGASVMGGAVNGSGLIRVRATHVGLDSLLSQMIDLVDQANADKPRIQRLVDRVSEVFVPIVLAIALLTFIVTFLIVHDPISAVLHSVAVLVIACPCAMGLATPTAIVVGSGLAAKSGVFFRDAEALEKAQSITTVVFDKTGTLTAGKPEVSEIKTEGSDREFLSAIASLQLHNSHPLAEAVVRYVQQLRIAADPASDVKNLPGRGVQGSVGGRSMIMGNLRLMKENSVAVSEHFQLGSGEETLAYVAELSPARRLLGVVSFRDSIRASSKEAVRELQEQKIEVHLLTGDHKKSAKKAADFLEIKHVTSDVLPAGKLELIRNLKSEGKVVAMVGDGINDGPAIAAADVGFAVSTGTDVAIGASGIALMRPDPMLVVEAIRISRRTYRKIKQNLFWAFIYNIVGIPLAAAGYLTPWVAGAAMALSSASVVGNSLLLGRQNNSKALK